MFCFPKESDIPKIICGVIDRSRLTDYFFDVMIFKELNMDAFNLTP